MSEEIIYFLEEAENCFKDEKYNDAITLCDDILDFDKNVFEVLYLRARCRYMIVDEADTSGFETARFDLMTAMTHNRKIFEDACKDNNFKLLFLSVFQNDPLSKTYRPDKKDDYGYEPEPVEETLEDLKQGITLENYKAWYAHVKSKLGYVPRGTNPGSIFGDPVPELLNSFFETRKELFNCVEKLSEQERIEFLKSHSFISFKDEYLEQTHSFGHLCEKNIFSPEENKTYRMTGAASVALYRKEFEYLSRNTQIPKDLQKSWKESVFTAWNYFCLPQLLEDLKFITLKEPENAKAHYYLAECLQCPENNASDEALESYRLFIKFHSEDKEPGINNYFISENYHKYYAFEPSLMEAYAGMARIFLKEGDLQNYEKYLIKAIEADKFHHGAPYLELAHFYFISGKTSKALQYTLVFEDIFEARVRGFDFPEEFYGGHHISREWVDDDDCHVHRSWNSARFTTMSDCLMLNSSRLQWRFKKYPHSAISLKYMLNEKQKVPDHKTRFETGFTDTRTLIQNFYINILNVIIVEEKKEEYFFVTNKIRYLYERCIHTESFTWECYPGLKRFTKEEKISMELFILSGFDGFKLMDRIAELIKLGFDKSELKKYIKNIKKYNPWVFNNKIKESADFDELLN